MLFIYRLFNFEPKINLDFKITFMRFSTMDPYFWGVCSTKTHKSNFQIEVFVWLKIEKSFNKKRSYIYL